MVGGLLWLPYGLFTMLQPWGVDVVYREAQGYSVRMLEDFSPTRPARAEAFPELSVREREVLSHLADGLTNQQIAARLYISPITVRNHVSSILTKLKLSNRRQAMIRAREADR